jgi:hypothetical protein
MGVKRGLSHSKKYIESDRGAEILGARSPRRQNFVRWRLNFLVRNVELAPGLLRWLVDVWKTCAHLS